MLLSYTEICELIEQGVIEGAKFEDVNSGSLDIHLGGELLLERESGDSGSDIIDYRARQKLPMERYRMHPEIGYVLDRHEAILGHTREVFHLTDSNCAEYKLKSSMARIFLEHLNAGWCDAGWGNSVLTLELINLTRFHRIHLRPDDAIGQMIFFKHTPVPEDRSYAARGRYNNDKTVSAIKP
jgi:dCTP deaminase